MNAKLGVLVASTGIIVCLAGCVPIQFGTAPGTRTCTTTPIPAPKGEKAYPLPCELLTAGPVLSRTVSLPNEEINVSPPAAGIKARVSSSQALEMAKGIGLYSPTGDISRLGVKLGVVFDNETRTVSAGKSVPAFYDRLVWVVSFAAFSDEDSSAGGVGPSGVPSPSAPASGWVNTVIFIDARTGAYLTAVEATVDQPA